MSNCPTQPGFDVTLNAPPFNVPFNSNTLARTYNRTGFTYMKFHSLQLRAMMLANPKSKLRPWAAFKSFAPKVWDALPFTGPTDFYEETLLHAGVLGADNFYDWNPW